MKIGAAAAASGVSQRMIRHYETIGLVPRQLRTDSNYRNYAPADIDRLRFIANARDLGFSLDEIRELIALWNDRNRASADVKKVALARAEELHAKAVKLETMRRTLLDLAAQCDGSDRPDCAIIEGLARG